MRYRSGVWCPVVWCGSVCSRKNPPERARPCTTALTERGTPPWWPPDDSWRRSAGFPRWHYLPAVAIEERNLAAGRPGGVEGRRAGTEGGAAENRIPRGSDVDGVLLHMLLLYVDLLRSRCCFGSLGSEEREEEAHCLREGRSWGACRSCGSSKAFLDLP